MTDIRLVFYSYYHNHHHLFTNGIVRDYIIYGDGENKTPDERIACIIESKWNINRKENMIVLPQEEPIGKIVGLPAHCPYGVRSHPGYCKMVKRLARDVKDKIEELASPEDCEEKKQDAKDLFNGVSEDCLEEIQLMAKKLDSIDNMPERIGLSKMSK